MPRPVERDVEYGGRGRSPFGTEVVGFSARGSLNRGDWDLTWNVALESGGRVFGESEARTPIVTLLFSSLRSSDAHRGSFHQRLSATPVAAAPAHTGSRFARAER